MVIGREVFAQGLKISVSVKIDSIAETYPIRNFICDSFTCIFQEDKFLFYEKSFRSANVDLSTGEVNFTIHLPPNKLLIENGRMISHNSLIDKMISMETSVTANPRLPFQLFKKFDVNKFEFTTETKNIVGIKCYKRSSVSSDGDSIIIWLQKDSGLSRLKSIFNLFFTQPPADPIMAITFRNFQLQQNLVDELSYQIYSFETGDYSKLFEELKNYKRVSQAEYIQELDAAMNAWMEKYNKEKGKN